MTTRPSLATARLRFDGPWMAVPLDADDPRAVAQREVAAFLGRCPELAPLGGRLVDELCLCVDECRPRGVIAAGFFSQVGDQGDLLEGWLEVRQADRQDSPEGGLAASLSSLAPDDTRPREVGEAALRAGEAVRVRGSRDVQSDAGAHGYVVEYLEYWLPGPTADRAAVVATMTPSVARSDRFVAAVDALVATLTLEW